MRIFGVSVITVVLVSVAYWAGTKGFLSRLTGAIGA